MMGYQTCGYINCCNHSGEYPERIDDVAYRGVVAVPCAGLAPVIPQARRDARSSVRAKPSPVVVDIRYLSSIGININRDYFNITIIFSIFAYNKV